jgi:hypothetical protein
VLQRIHARADPVRDADLGVAALDVIACRLLADHQRFRDLFVGSTARPGTAPRSPGRSAPARVDNPNRRYTRGDCRPVVPPAPNHGRCTGCARSDTDEAARARIRPRSTARAWTRCYWTRRCGPGRGRGPRGEPMPPRRGQSPTATAASAASRAVARECPRVNGHLRSTKSPRAISNESSDSASSRWCRSGAARSAAAHASPAGGPASTASASAKKASTETEVDHHGHRRQQLGTGRQLGRCRQRPG